MFQAQALEYKAQPLGTRHPLVRFGFEMENFMRLQQSPRNARTVRLDVEPLHRSKQEWHCDFWAGKIGGREGE